VAGFANQTEGAREEYRTATKPFPIRFHARRNGAPRLGALDHDHTHIAPPGFFVPTASCFATGWNAPFSRGALAPADPGGLQKVSTKN
jgi:hypothetical protein